MSAAPDRTGNSLPLMTWRNDLLAPADDIAEDLSAVDKTTRDFQAVHGENPIGSNAEITAALLGNNRKQSNPKSRLART